MAERASEMDPRIMRAMDFSSLQAVRLYCAMFFYFKSMGMNVNFSQYRDAVRDRAGFVLNKEYYNKTKTIFSKLPLNEGADGVKTSEDGCKHEEEQH